MTEQRAIGIGEQFGIPSDSFIGKASMLIVPYCTMDGVNEKGVMVSVLELTPGGFKLFLQNRPAALFMSADH